MNKSLFVPFSKTLNVLKTNLLFEANLITISLRLQTDNKSSPFSFLFFSPFPSLLCFLLPAALGTFYDSEQFAFYSVFLMSHGTAENSLVYSVR